MESGYVFAIGAAVAWGLVYAIDQKILTGVSPIMLLFINSVLTTILLLPYILFGRESLKNVFGAGKVSMGLIIVEVVFVVLANYLILSSIKHLNASAASIIEIAYPFFVVVFCFLFFGSKPNLSFILGGGLVFMGSYIIIRFAS